jgi:hypothetical protein
LQNSSFAPEFVQRCTKVRRLAGWNWSFLLKHFFVNAFVRSFVRLFVCSFVRLLFYNISLPMRSHCKKVGQSLLKERKPIKVLLTNDGVIASWQIP